MRHGNDGGDQTMTADLFNYRKEYPNQAGYKRPGTSKDAAAKVRAPTLRDQVLATLKLYDLGLTADQCAYYMGVSILSIRPRFSELLRLGLIFDAGITRKNDSGVQATVWRSF